MAKFMKCVQESTFRGRLKAIGDVVIDNDGVLEDHKCWEAFKPKKAEPPKKDKKEEARQALLEAARALGLKPAANTGVPKLKAAIKEAEEQSAI